MEQYEDVIQIVSILIIRTRRSQRITAVFKGITVLTRRA